MMPYEYVTSDLPPPVVTTMLPSPPPVALALMQQSHQMQMQMQMQMQGQRSPTQVPQPHVQSTHSKQQHRSHDAQKNRLMIEHWHHQQQQFNSAHPAAAVSYSSHSNQQHQHLLAIGWMPYQLQQSPYLHSSHQTTTPLQHQAQQQHQHRHEKDREEKRDDAADEIVIIRRGKPSAVQQQIPQETQVQQPQHQHINRPVPPAIRPIVSLDMRTQQELQFQHHAQLYQQQMLFHQQQQQYNQKQQHQQHAHQQQQHPQVTLQQYHQLHQPQSQLHQLNYPHHQLFVPHPPPLSEQLRSIGTPTLLVNRPVPSPPPIALIPPSSLLTNMTTASNNNNNSSQKRRSLPHDPESKKASNFLKIARAKSSQDASRPRTSPAPAALKIRTSSNAATRIRDATTFASAASKRSIVVSRQLQITQPDYEANEEDPFPEAPNEEAKIDRDDSDLSDDGELETDVSSTVQTNSEWTTENDAFIDGLAVSFQQQPVPTTPTPTMAVLPSPTTTRRPRTSHSILQRSPRTPSATRRSASPAPPLSHTAASIQQQRPRTTSGMRASTPSSTSRMRIGSANSLRPSPVATATKDPTMILNLLETKSSAVATAVAVRQKIRPPPITLQLNSPFYDRLPLELWSLMSSYLDTSSLLTNLARIDRASRKAVEDQELWHHIQLPSEIGRNAETQDKIRLHHHHSHHSNTKDTNSIGMIRLLALSTRWTLISSLDLSACGAFLRDELFSQISTHTMQCWSISLRSLRLAKCALLTDAALITLSSACTKLTVLDLSWCGLFTNTGFESIVRACSTSLQACILNRCIGVSDETLRMFADHAKALLELDLTFCTNLTDIGLALLAKKESVCFYSPSQQREQQLSRISSPPYPGLQRLSLRWCRKLTDVGIRCLMSGGSTIDVHQESSTALTSTGVQVTSTASRSTPSLLIPSLRSLNIDHCSLLTDRAIMYISQAAVNLRTLSAIYCKMLTPLTFQYLLSGCTSQLRCLVFDHCDHMHTLLSTSTSSSSSLRHLLSQRNFLSLRVLSWHTCTHIGMERTRHQEIEAECGNSQQHQQHARTNDHHHHNLLPRLRLDRTRF